MMNAAIHNEMPTTAIAFGRGPCRKSSEPINIGIGPKLHTTTRHIISNATLDYCYHVRNMQSRTVAKQLERGSRGFH